MTTALVSKEFIAQLGDAFKAVGESAGKPVTFITLPEEKGARLSQADCDSNDCIYLGEVIDENALIEGLHSGHLGDTHTQEPLPKDAPLWDLPNGIVAPHNASASTGNEGRGAQMFVANFGHWVCGEPMFNVQQI